MLLLDKDGHVINFKELWDKKTFSYQYLSSLNNITLLYYHKKEDNSKDAEVTLTRFMQKYYWKIVDISSTHM